MRKIYCIGDSHSSMFSGKNGLLPTNQWIENKEFNIFHAGPITAFNCSKKDNVKVAYQSVPTNEHILFLFGEIDMRCRVGLAENKFENIDLIINNYFELINNTGHENIIVSGIVPCIVNEPMKDWFDADETRKSIFTATRGSLKERNEYKKYFNNKVSEICEKNGYIFIDYWDSVINNKELFQDDVHLNGELIIDILRKEIKKKI